MSQPAEPSSPTASSKTSSQSRRTHRHSHTRSAASLSNLPSSGVGPSSKPTRNAHSASSSLTKIIVDALRPDPVNDPSSSTASASGTALMKSKSQELHGRGKSVASTTATTSAAARLMPKERRPRTFSTSTCASTFSDTKSSRIRLRVKARMIARQLAISSDEAKQSLVQIRIDSADRSRQSAERALRESLVQKATLESTLDALRRELQDSRSQLEDCRREKESLQIENSMLVEELAELRRHPSMLGVGKSVRARASSSTIRQRAHTYVFDFSSDR
ncbi:hypothetical protein DL93DRAFT_788027 [Clavulina sp. PMI_390]|nr:hypothetical protein DL93DRAFT_788027 [Clavulina sp. PMI_390]